MHAFQVVLHFQLGLADADLGPGVDRAVGFYKHALVGALGFGFEIGAPVVQLVLQVY